MCFDCYVSAVPEVFAAKISALLCFGFDVLWTEPGNGLGGCFLGFEFVETFGWCDFVIGFIHHALTRETIENWVLLCNMHARFPE